MNIFTRMKAILFCRVSSREQEETGYSLPAQEKFLREYAAKQGFEVAKAFAVSESASGKIQRKIFNEMIDHIRKNDISIVIVETTDRLTRNFADVPTIDKWILENETNQIHLAKESCLLHKDSKSHEWFMWRVKVATAEYYVRLLSENVKKGQKEKIRQGWLPTKPPLGYKTIGEKGHKIHVIDETKAPLIKKMFDLYTTGNYSLNKLTEVMCEAGLHNENGNKIVKSRIHEFLRDPFYIGKNRWNDELSDGQQATFISKDVFDKVQYLLKSKTTPKYNKHNYLFKGLAGCKECGGTITWEIHKGIIYGHCNHYRNCSQKAWVKEYEVETGLLEVFDNLQIKNTRIVEWIRKALKESHQDEITYRTTAINELYQKQEQLRQRLDKLYDDKLDGKITEEFYGRKAKQYQEELEKVTDSIKNHDNANIKYYELCVNIYDLSQKAKEIYLKAKQRKMLDEQRVLMRLMFARLTLDEGRLSYEYTPAFKLLHEVVMVTNSSKMANVVKNGDRIFEPKEKVEIASHRANFYPIRPAWLPREDSNLQP